MANLCTRGPAPNLSQSYGYVPNANASTGTNFNDGKHKSGALDVGTSVYLWIPVGGAFDADQYGITCQAFDNAAVSVASLQAGLANLQTQVTALVSGSEVRAPNPEIIEAQAIVFGAVLTAGVLIWGGKRIYNLFMHPPGSGEKE